MSSTSSPIEDYLDELFRRLRHDPRHARRAIAEVEEHLRDAAREEQGRGLAPIEAEARAVSRFGPVELIPTTAGRRPTAWRIAVELAGAVGLLAAIGLLAVGVSGAVAAVMNLVAGPEFVGGTGGAGVSGAGCQQLLRAQPGAVNCARAAVLENSDDAVVLRLLAGALGLAILGVVLLWRRRRPSLGLLPGSLAPTAALSLFGVAAGALFAASAGLRPIADPALGAGFYLSGGVVALACAVGALAVLVRSLRTAETS